MWLCCLLRAKLKYHCKAPGKHILPAYVSDTVVAEMRSGWDLNQLSKGNTETIKGTALSSLLITIQPVVLHLLIISFPLTIFCFVEVRCPTNNSSIGFTSSGPTEGLISFTEAAEEKPSAAAETDDKTEVNYPRPEHDCCFK